MSSVLKEAVKVLYRPVRNTVMSLKPVSYRYRCPVCGCRVQKFNPLDERYLENKQKYGSPYGPEDSETMNYENYSCPSCHATDRDRMSALYLRDKFSRIVQGRFLTMIDFAPSKALQQFIVKLNRIHYRSADYSMPGVDDHIDIMDMDIYDDCMFDSFMCSHVLEHVTDDGRALSELYRILKPGGWGILMVPINLKIDDIDEDPTVEDEGERWRRFGQGDHIRLYSKRGFVERVERAGFFVNQYGVDYFGEKVFHRHGITSKSVLYVVEKAMSGE